MSDSKCVTELWCVRERQTKEEEERRREVFCFYIYYLIPCFNPDLRESFFKKGLKSGSLRHWSDRIRRTVCVKLLSLIILVNSLYYDYYCYYYIIFDDYLCLVTQ